ncbi:MAG: hypothetical protein GY737_00055 [Desulfobacteraceae bacterium]|nr:hypothetical protein [Desulfobacteraceae bacterium]
MIPNVNEKTGIAYGVVSMGGLAEWVWDEFYAHGQNTSEEDAYCEWREQMGVDVEPTEEAEQEFWDTLEIDEPNWHMNYTDADGVRLHLQIGWLGGAPLLWVLESPHTTFALACSPCVPGAGDLDNTVENPNDVDKYRRVTCYTLPSEWFWSADA